MHRAAAKKDAADAPGSVAANAAANAAAGTGFGAAFGGLIGSGRANEQAMVEAKEDDEDELPWQVIALLDQDILSQLVWAARHRKERVAEAKAGGGMPKPKPFTLEGAFEPGTWLFRIVDEGGARVYSKPEDGARSRGKRRQGEYVRGVELHDGGRWLLLAESEEKRMKKAAAKKRRRYEDYDDEDSDEDMRDEDDFDEYDDCYDDEEAFRQFFGGAAGGGGAYFNADHAFGRRQKQLWMRVYSGEEERDASGSGSGSKTVHLEMVDAEDMAFMGDVVEAEQEDGGMKGELFDKPFVPRLGESAAAASNGEGPAAKKAKTSHDIDDIDDIDDDIDIDEDEEVGGDGGAGGGDAKGKGSGEDSAVAIAAAAASARAASALAASLPVGAVVEVRGLGAGTKSVRPKRPMILPLSLPLSPSPSN